MIRLAIENLADSHPEKLSRAPWGSRDDRGDVFHSHQRLQR